MKTCPNCGTEIEGNICTCCLKDVSILLKIGTGIIDEVEHQTWKRNLEERKKNKRERVYGR